MDQVRTNVPESPVDNAARRQLAELIERLVAGELTTDKFAAQAQELALGSSDPAVDAIYLAADSFYSDLWSYRLRGRRALPPSVLTHVARWVLFLRTSTPLTARLPNRARPTDWGDGCLLGVTAICVPATAVILAISPLWAAPVFGVAVAAWWFSSSPLRRRRREVPAAGDPLMYWPFASQADSDAAVLARETI
ncbi:MAG: hypothetical protein U0574_11410 [Phycisphaerales bacterium]